MRILRAVLFLALMLTLVYFAIGSFKLYGIAALIVIILLFGFFIGVISWLVGNVGKK